MKQKDIMKEPVTQLQLAEWSRMSLSSIHKVRTEANIAICLSCINSVAVLIFLIGYLIR